MLTLKRVGTFDFSGHTLTEFVQTNALPDIEDDAPELHRAAARVLQAVRQAAHAAGVYPHDVPFSNHSPHSLDRGPRGRVTEAHKRPPPSPPLRVLLFSAGRRRPRPDAPGGSSSWRRRMPDNRVHPAVQEDEDTHWATGTADAYEHCILDGWCVFWYFDADTILSDYIFFFQLYTLLPIYTLLMKSMASSSSADQCVVDRARMVIRGSSADQGTADPLFEICIRGEDRILVSLSVKFHGNSFEEDDGLQWFSRGSSIGFAWDSPMIFPANDQGPNLDTFCRSFDTGPGV
ncbi:hypothetical protein DFH07DRAFT_942790 [Mycena maculata]|uniref:Uncharacterized protein n=1 Tax=Mycena maculata TaxID=230809 RepID=A0AAD7IP98_9AGAR|nr:hypothetical protein DFH07DRAFT_942790 [Mycena maculata]